MVNLSEIEAAAALLSPEDKQKLYMWLAQQIGREVSQAGQGGHSILDIPPVFLGKMLKPFSPDDDILGEMLEGRS